MIFNGGTCAHEVSGSYSRALKWTGAITKVGIEGNHTAWQIILSSHRSTDKPGPRISTTNSE